MPGQIWGAAGSLLAALFCVACDRSGSHDPKEFVSVVVRGTSFEAIDRNGKIWRSKDLVGSVLSMRHAKSISKIRIDSVSADAGSPDVLLHQFSVPSSDGSWRSLCRRAPDGLQVGFPIRGQWTANGRLSHSRPDEFEVVCAAGAQGKCIRLGYFPWRRLPDGTSGLTLFNACVRMIRADYAGNGKPQTKDGTLIAVADRFGLQDRGWNSGVQFEAGWSDAGAVCVHHTRVPGQASLNEVEKSSNRLVGLTGDVCTREKAEALGAVIFNGSRA